MMRHTAHVFPVLLVCAASSPTLANVNGVEVNELVEGVFLSAVPSGGSPPTGVDFDFEIRFRADAPVGYWVEDLGIEMVDSYSSWDLGLGNLTQGTQAEVDLMKSAFEAIHGEVDFFSLWIAEPGGGSPPSFFVSSNADVPLPVSTFGPSDSPFGFNVGISSPNDVGDGIVGWRFTGTVMPAPGGLAAMLVCAPFLRRRRR